MHASLVSSETIPVARERTMTDNAVLQAPIRTTILDGLQITIAKPLTVVAATT
jgi:hypothetical protein